MTSITIPSQTMSVRTILDRYARGLPLEGRRNPQYYDGEFPDIAGLDLSEIAALKRAAQEQVEQYKQNLKKQEESNRKQKEQKLLEQIEELKKQIPNNSNEHSNPLRSNPPPLP